MDHTDHTNTSVITKIPVPVVSAVVRSGPSTLTDLVRYSDTESNKDSITPALSQLISFKRSRDRSRKSLIFRFISFTALLHTLIVSTLRPRRSAAETAIREIIKIE